MRQIKLEELEQLLFEVRKLSVMRGLLEQVDKRIVSSALLAELEKVAKDIKVQKGMLVMPTTIPAKKCYEVLEKSVSLRLNRFVVGFGRIKKAFLIL